MVDLTSHDLSGELQAPSKVSFSLFGVTLSLLDIFLLVLMGCLLGLQLSLQFTQKINWDEFFYLSHIYEAQGGTLSKVLQMAHVYVLGWITQIPGGEIAQIKFGRLFMWCVQLITLGLIVKTARRFMSITSALFAALCFISIGFIFIHGTSFRADPLAACLMAYAIYVFAASDFRVRHLIGLTFALPIGALITVKVVLFAPLLAVLAMWRLKNAPAKGLLLFKFSLVALAALILFLIGYLFQGSQIVVEGGGDSISGLSNTINTVFFSSSIFPRAQVMKVGLITGLLPTIMIIIGTFATIITYIKTPKRCEVDVVILVFLLPLLSFAFYRNAYPYFYAFIFPSAVLLAGYAVERLKLSKIIIACLAGLMVINIVMISAARKDETLSVQTQTLEAVHMMFPEPIAYFDRNGMISSFPKANFFMSSWGLRNYALKGETLFVAEMEKKVVPLLIDNSPVISAALRGEPSGLLAQDASALKDNYIPHWGHIWVAGKTLSATAQPLEFGIIIPGIYTIESERNVTINGVTYSNGDVIDLSRDKHSVSSSSSQTLILRWGNQMPRPNYSASPKPIFGAF